MLKLGSRYDERRLRSFIDTLRRMASEALAASIFKNLVGSGSSGSGWIGSLMQAFAGSYHDGGIVGQDGTAMAINPLVFAGAPRYHSGGIAGLAPDEVPAILQKGEMVIPRDQVGAAAGPQQISIRNILVDDQRNVADFMSSSEGERIHIQNIKRNAMTIRSILGG